MEVVFPPIRQNKKGSVILDNTGGYSGIYACGLFKEWVEARTFDRNIIMIAVILNRP
jgi:hypothetical protein